MRPLVAVGGDTLTSLGPDLTDVPTLVIAGPPRTGRSTALLTAARSLLAAGTGLIVLAPRRSPLRTLRDRPGVAAVITDAEVTVNEFREALGNIPEEHGVIVVDDAELFMGAEIDSDLALLARGGAGTGWGLMPATRARQPEEFIPDIPVWGLCRNHVNDSPVGVRVPCGGLFTPLGK
ncbi:hypothetical protein AB0L10_39610 [Streptomyces flaveolus]|uniref:hypothetical protein n=1 Tax=Streptomyces flaveolus TaxID=67297 RepID=UPI00342D569D